MTVQVKKKFDSIDDGINNMLDAAAWDYSGRKFTHTTASDFRDKFIVKVGQKYIKIGRKSDYNSDKMGQVWAFVVNTDDDKNFKRGDVLKAAGFNAPARNAPRGNVLDGGFNINWTGPEYL
jgi:hypothetical protein